MSAMSTMSVTSTMTPMTPTTPMSTASLRYRAQFPARLVGPAPTRVTYLRRRLVVAVTLLSLVGTLGVTAQQGLADRGGDPASASAIGQSTDSAPGGPLGATYVVQPGDTLWSVAERLHPGGDLGRYVDVLVSLNGGARITVGQQLLLP